MEQVRALRTAVRTYNSVWGLSGLGSLGFGVPTSIQQIMHHLCFSAEGTCQCIAC